MSLQKGRFWHDSVRSTLGGSAKKVGKRIKELERIYGIQNGNNQYERLPKLSEGKVSNQSDIAEMIGISVDTLNNYKKLTELIPELEELLDTGVYIFDYSYIIIHSIDNALQKNV